MPDDRHWDAVSSPNHADPILDSHNSVLSSAAFVAMGVGVVRAMPLVLIVAAIMALVALLATVGPGRRGVRIQATEALRAQA